jgi:cytoskeletal protein RodZ
MRTDDHDPMHERREAMTAWERGLRPKRERHWVLWLALSVLLVFLLYRGAEWLLTQRSPRPQQPPAVQSPVVPPLATGRSTAPAPSSTPPGAAAPDTFEVTKCLTPSGKAAYSDGPCPEGSRATTVRLRRDVNLADGMSVEEREASNRNSAAIAGQQQQYERQVARNVDNAMAECSQLEAHIKWIDIVARQPQGAYSQDWLRNERQATRDRQFRLRCQ